jgi:hypothetical protein
MHHCVSAVRAPDSFSEENPRLDGLPWATVVLSTTVITTNAVRAATGCLGIRHGVPGNRVVNPLPSAVQVSRHYLCQGRVDSVRTINPWGFSKHQF